MAKIVKKNLVIVMADILKQKFKIRLNDNYAYTDIMTGLSKILHCSIVVTDNKGNVKRKDPDKRGLYYFKLRFHIEGNNIFYLERSHDESLIDKIQIETDNNKKLLKKKLDNANLKKEFSEQKERNNNEIEREDTKNEPYEKLEEKLLLILKKISIGKFDESILSGESNPSSKVYESHKKVSKIKKEDKEDKEDKEEFTMEKFLKRHKDSIIYDEKSKRCDLCGRNDKKLLKRFNTCYETCYFGICIDCVVIEESTPDKSLERYCYKCLSIMK